MAPLNQQEGRNESSLREPLLTPSERRTETTRAPPSRNVTLTLLYTGFAFAGRSIWSQSVLATFVFLLKNNNAQAVGYITAAMGLSQLVASFPAGIIADWDSIRRDSILKIASVLGCLAVFATLLACWHENYIYLVVALTIWGTCWGVANTALTALFADSIPRGDRSYYFTQRSMILKLGNICGPAVALAMFVALGNEWTVRECAVVLAVGQCVCFPSLVLLCFFDDRYAVIDDNHEEQVACDNQESNQERDLEASQRINQEEGCPRRQSTNQQQASEQCVAMNGESGTVDSCLPSDDSQQEPEEAHSCCTFLLRKRQVPLLIASADLMAGLASGMSIRYFPIFFVDNLHLTPVLVQVLYAVTPLVNAILMKAGEVLATRWGRLHVAVALKWIGIFFFVSLIVASKYHVHAYIICIIYVLRTAFVNSTAALTRSMLMDHVPCHERGKWSALESVNMFSWSGSAALGGVLVGLLGSLLPLFAITAGLQFVATFPLIFLFSQDYQEQEAVRRSAPRATTTTTSRSTSCTSFDSNGSNEDATGEVCGCESESNRHETLQQNSI